MSWNKTIRGDILNVCFKNFKNIPLAHLNKEDQNYFLFTGENNVIVRQITSGKTITGIFFKELFNFLRWIWEEKDSKIFFKNTKKRIYLIYENLEISKKYGRKINLSKIICEYHGKEFQWRKYNGKIRV